MACSLEDDFDDAFKSGALGLVYFIGGISVIIILLGGILLVVNPDCYISMIL